jgi:hypothetical protein
MNRILLALMFGLALGLPLQAQETDARAILDKAMKAQGDEKVAQKLLSVIGKAKGKLHLMDMALNLSVQTWNQLPGKTKAVISMTGDGASFEIVQAINGDKGWVSFDGNVTDLDSDQLKEAMEMMHVEKVINLFTIKGDKDLKFTPLGDSKVGDTPVVGIKVSKTGKRDVSLFFDKKSSLLVKAQYRARDPISQEEVTQEKLYSGFKEFVPGFKSPSIVTVKNDGQPFMELEITEVRTVERHDDAIFAKPN